VPDDRPRKSSPPAAGRSRTPLNLRLPEVDFDLANAARRVIEASLGVVTGDRVVIVVDQPREPLGATLAEVARSVGATAELVLLDQLGRRPLRSLPASLRAELTRAQASVLLVGFEEGEWAMRREYVTLITELRLRHAHMIGVGRRAMLSGFSVDHQRILDATRAVRTRLRPDSVLRLRTPAGSDLEVKLDPRHRWQERVGIIRPGRWENLPSGELFTCPGDVNGVFVADGSMGGALGAATGVLTRAPLRLTIKGGTCRSVQSVDRALSTAVEALLRAERAGDKVGMVVLGTNVGMREATGEVLADQIMPGLHLGFGATFPEQTGASWDAPTQLSMVATGADVDLDGSPLLRQGRYLVL
jgi:leucyl aminopeptidase (aminopeptidase T)